MSFYLADLEKAINEETGVVIFTYMVNGEGNTRISLCTKREEYISTSYSVFFNESVEPKIVKVYGTPHPSWEN